MENKEEIQSSKVSVVIPTYKSTKTLWKAIDSALEQSWNNVEVIVVDDNSPNTAYRRSAENLMKKYKDNPRVLYIQHSTNKNGSAARNTGFQHSSGKYICLLDDDDYFLPEKIEKQIQYMEKYNDIDAVGCYFKKKEEIYTVDAKGNHSKEIFLLETTPHTSTLMIRREVFEELNGFDETYYRHQDYEFLLRFFQKYKIGIVKECLVVVDTNYVNNRPNGKKLEEIKKKLLTEFQPQIIELDKQNPGFKNQVYARHLQRIWIAYIKGKDAKNAIRIFVKGVTTYGWIFIKEIENYVQIYKRSHKN